MRGHSPVRFAVLLVVATALNVGTPRAATVVPEWAIAVFPSGAEFNLEIAVTPEARARGYMFREEVGPTEGMLFLMGQPGRHGFWMKNCKVALDLIWLSADLEVVHIAHDQQPCPENGECPMIAPLKAGSYVLEVAGGTASREGLSPGDHLVILSEPDFP